MYLFILLVLACMRFLLRSSRVCIIEFCVLLHLNQIQHSLNDSEDSYAEFRAVKDKMVILMMMMMMMTFHLPDMD